MKGRLPLPTETKKLRGTYQANKENLNAAEYDPVDTLDIPEDVAANPLAREIWQRLVEIFTAERVLTYADQDALEMLCLSWARFKQCHRQVEEEGLTVAHETKYGTNVIRHPTLVTLKESQSQVERLLAHFGMTPATRRKVSSLKDNVGDPLEELREEVQRAHRAHSWG